MNLKNKVAVVTGGKSRIGFATAKELKEQGATVIITGRRKEALEQAALEIDAIPFIADQSRVQDIDGLSKASRRRTSRHLEMMK